MRVLGDMIEWCSQQMPRWHPVSISVTTSARPDRLPSRELAFTLKDGLTYVQQAVDRGLDVDDFAPAVVLLQRPDRLLRGDRQAPRRAANLGARMRDTYGARTRARG
jgi:methylmalonyl-CoA mutase N-terminal domain/subunit